MVGLVSIALILFGVQSIILFVFSGVERIDTMTMPHVTPTVQYFAVVAIPPFAY